ncbi:hypothetical protein FOCG_01122 [Fusarium oxysporum f. sp. radicis-lycopersici 26381]|uniref:Uncharacterized protein n=1 Tax=Fusarium oxysporum Fo47 TaxID=660027 RepID=W9KVW5_FUSOX|nr:hypothetical protein FOZG_05618 [Fusarium oxysporum Fo47]EXL62566.1 hypothetical protein FOCG_01122 [Fusarium oxysporum f. sp. radicis-lycopersici 26381]
MEPFLVASVCFFVVDHDHLNFAPAHPNVDNPGRGGDSVRASVMLDGRWAHRMLCSQCNAVRHRDEIWDVRLSLGRRIYCDIFIRVVRSSGYKFTIQKAMRKDIMQRIAHLWIATCGKGLLGLSRICMLWTSQSRVLEGRRYAWSVDGMPFGLWPF